MSTDKCIKIGASMYWICCSTKPWINENKLPTRSDGFASQFKKSLSTMTTDTRKMSLVWFKAKDESWHLWFLDNTVLSPRNSTSVNDFSNRWITWECRLLKRSNVTLSQRHSIIFEDTSIHSMFKVKVDKSFSTACVKEDSLRMTRIVDQNITPSHRTTHLSIDVSEDDIKWT